MREIMYHRTLHEGKKEKAKKNKKPKENSKEKKIAYDKRS